MIRRFPCDEDRCNYVVGRFRVRPSDGIVTDGERTCRLEPQVMSVLVYLADNSGRVISREELIREVWGGTAVSDGAVTRCIGVIRKALGAGNADDPIHTLPKRGYRLTAPVRRETATRAVRARPSRPVVFRVAVALVLGLAALAVVRSLPDASRPDPVTVIIEPFQDLDATSAQEAWGASVTEETIAALHTQPGLNVVLGPRDPGLPGAVLTGSVRREGDEARLSCRLADGATGKVLCAGACSIPATPRLDAQRQAGSRAAGAVGGVLARR